MLKVSIEVRSGAARFACSGSGRKHPEGDEPCEQTKSKCAAFGTVPDSAHLAGLQLLRSVQGGLEHNDEGDGDIYVRRNAC